MSSDEVIASTIGREPQGACSPMVSVIVPTYNRPEGLAQAIRSILEQTYQDFEIVVVNDAGALVESVLTQFEGESRINYIRHPRNMGLAAARNTGIRIAKGKYIAYLDDDDRFYPEHLETLVKFLEANPQKVAYTDAYRIHQAKVGGVYVETSRDLPYSFDFDADRFLVGNYVPVLCFMHEKACLELVGDFDETLTSHEDWELWIRLSRVFDFFHIKAITCEYTWRNDGSSMTSSKRADYLRTLKLIYAKHAAPAMGKPHVLAERQLNLAYIQAEVEALGAQPVSVVPVELPDRRGFNIATHGDESDFQGVLEAYLCAFTDGDEVALHVLTTSLDHTQERVLAMLDALGLDAEKIPDVSLLEVAPEDASAGSYLAAADLIVGTGARLARLMPQGIPFVEAPDAADLMKAYSAKVLR